MKATTWHSWSVKSFKTNAIRFLLIWLLATTTANAASPRVLDFPGDDSYGKIILLGKNWDVMAKRNMGKFLSDARGAVKVDKSEPLMLVANYALADHPQVLNKLPPDAFDCIVFENIPAEDKIFGPLSRLTGLKRLEFKEGEFNDKAFVQVRSLVNLEALLVHECFVTGASITQLGDLKKLRMLHLVILDLNWPLLAKSGPSFPNLVQLGLGKTGMTDEGLAWVERMPHLQKLDINDNRLTGSGFVHFKKLKELNSISLKRTPVKLEGLIQLKSLPSLKEIDFSRAQLPPNDIKKLAAVLTHTKLTMPQGSQGETFELFAPLH